MDQFGIFELLDTLAGLVSGREEDAKAEEKDKRPSTDDKSFEPPDFGKGSPAKGSSAAQKSALDSLYRRHGEISKRIDEKK